MPIPRPDDLLRRAQRGDRDAREALVVQHGPRIYGLCRRLCSDPDDAYQEIWAKAFAALPRFDPEGPAQLSTWLGTIAHRHLIDRHRRKTARGQVLDLADIADPSPDAAQRLSATQQRTRLVAAVDRLPEAHRRVVLLHHLLGQPLEIIAETEGVAVGTIKSRLHRARGRLVELLGRSS